MPFHLTPFLLETSNSNNFLLTSVIFLLILIDVSEEEDTVQLTSMDLDYENGFDFSYL